MKRLLSLLLVIAMLFGVCTIFTACDSTSVSDEEEEKDSGKKKNNPLDTFEGMEVSLPKTFKKVDSNEYSSTYANDDYTVSVSYSENEGESAKSFWKDYKEQVEESLEDGYFEEGDASKTDKGTYYVYGVLAEENYAIAIAFYATDNSYWMVQIRNNEENEEYDVEQMIKYITDWKYDDPKEEAGEGENEGEGNEGEVAPEPPTAVPGTNPAPTEEAPAPDVEVSVDGQIIYDNMGIEITYTGSYDYPNCICFALTIVNNSSYDVELKCGDILLNGVAYLDDDYTIYAMSGCTTNTAFSCYYDELARLYVDYIGSINFTVDILNCADYEYLLTGGSACIKTDMYGYEQPMDSYGVTLMEENGLRVILQGFNFEGEENTCMWLYIENNNDVPVGMDLVNPTVNNWTFTSITGTAYVPSHAYAVVPVDVYQLVEFGIYDEASIHSMRFTMNFYDASGYYGVELCTYDAYYCPGYADIVQDMPAESIVLYDGYAFELRLFKIESYYSNAVVRLLMCNYRDDIPVYVLIENVMINGQPVTDEFYGALDVEERCLSDLWLYSNGEIGFYGVEDLQSLSFTLTVLDHTHYPIFEEVIEVPIN